MMAIGIIMRDDMSNWLHLPIAWLSIATLCAAGTAIAATPAAPPCAALASIDMRYEDIERAFGSDIVGWTETDFQSVRTTLVDCAPEITFFRGYDLGAVGWYIDQYLSDIRNEAVTRQKQTSYDLRHSALEAQVNQLRPKAVSGALSDEDTELLADLKRQGELLRREFIHYASDDITQLDYQIDEILRDNQQAIDSEARWREQQERHSASVAHHFDLDALREEPTEALRQEGEAPLVLSSNAEAILRATPEFANLPPEHGFASVLVAVAAEAQVGACSDGWPEFSSSYAAAQKTAAAYIELGQILGFIGEEQRVQITSAYETADGLRRNGLALMNTPEQYLFCKTSADGVTAAAAQMGIR